MKTYNLAFLVLLLFLFASPIKESQQKLNKNKPAAANIVLKSIDGGQTWQDISEGLPEDLKLDEIRGDDCFANETGFYLSAGENGIYHNKPGFIVPYWKKESSCNSQQGTLRTLFETAGGTVFTSSTGGLLKSTNSGKSWKKVTGGWVGKMIEADGVLLATSQNGIIRSADDGENWEGVLHEGGNVIALEPIKGGFATINYNTQSMTRRVRTSYDGGKTWEAIDAGLKADLSIASIKEVGEYLYCGHPDGIFRSADKGKTWKLLLPSIDNKVFNLFVSGNVIYAVPLSGGC